MNENRPTMRITNILIVISLALLVCTALFACTANAPAPPSASPSETAAVSPELTPAEGNAPGAVTEAGPSQEPEQTPSPTVEEAMKIRSVVEQLKGVEDLAVVVTDSKQAIVAVVLAQGAKLDDTMEHQIIATANSDTEVRVTADPGQLVTIRELEEQLYETGALPSSKVDSLWNDL